MRPTITTSSARDGDGFWRQQIQDDLIAALQNVRILLTHGKRPQRAVANIMVVNFEKTEARPQPTQPSCKKPAAPRGLGLADSFLFLPAPDHRPTPHCVPN